jgi:hypothetical protein
MTWITTVAKLAPHVIELGKLAISAVPHFTQAKGDASPALEDKTLQRQIAELQAAATDNADAIRKIAGDLQAALTTLEQAAEAAERRIRRVERLVYLAIAVSLGALAACASIGLR